MTNSPQSCSAASEVQLPLSTDMVLTAAKEVQTHLDTINKPYSAGIVGDCVVEIERLRGQVKLSDNLLDGLTAVVEGLKAELAERIADDAQSVVVPNREVLHQAAKDGNLQYWRDGEAQRAAFDTWRLGGYDGDCPQLTKGTIVDYITDAIIAALAAQPPAAPVETKSAPVFLPPRNNGERLPSSDAAGAGADTGSSAETEEYQRCMDMLADVPGSTLEDRLTHYIGSYMALQLRDVPQAAVWQPINETTHPSIRSVAASRTEDDVCGMIEFCGTLAGDVPFIVARSTAFGPFDKWMTIPRVESWTAPHGTSALSRPLSP